MAPHPNGTLPHPGDLGRIHVAPLTVRDDHPLSLGANLLNELDDLIAALSSAMEEQATAKTVIADSEAEIEILRASLALTLSVPPEASRKAALTMACVLDPGYQELVRVVREARAALFSADRKVAVVKARIDLVRAALALLAGKED